MRSLRGTRWVYTLNNYSNAEERALIDFSELPICRYHVFGREVGQSGTPHLQGFIIFREKKTLVWIKRELSSRAHWELARGDSASASTYCKKDGDFYEHGDLNAQGERTDLDSAREWIYEFTTTELRAPTDRELALAHPGPFIRYRRGLMDYARAIVPPPVLRTGQLRQWQSELDRALAVDADDRSILFYVDEAGNTGKTWFIGWYYSQHPTKTQIIGSGSYVDMAYAYDETKEVVFFNVARGGMEFLQYRFLEHLKDRMVFSTKYESRMKVPQKCPHVIVMCNEAPNMEKLTPDRMIITEL